MDDLFSSPPAPQLPQALAAGPITPTQTLSAHHLGQKGDILSLFGPPAGAAPGPPSAPTTPNVGFMGELGAGAPSGQGAGGLLAPPPGGSLILSQSFTEPGPMELDPLGDMFGEPASSRSAPAPPAVPPTFYIDESDSAKNLEAEKSDGGESKKDEAESVTPQPKTSFWSWWGRKPADTSSTGSKENILEEGEKKPEEGKEPCHPQTHTYTDGSFPASSKCQMPVTKQLARLARKCAV
jgi:hypothetical protein